MEKTTMKDVKRGQEVHRKTERNGGTFFNKRKGCKPNQTNSGLEQNT